MGSARARRGIRNYSCRLSLIITRPTAAATKDIPLIPLNARNCWAQDREGESNWGIPASSCSTSYILVRMLAESRSLCSLSTVAGLFTICQSHFGRRRTDELRDRSPAKGPWLHKRSSCTSTILSILSRTRVWALDLTGNFHRVLSTRDDSTWRASVTFCTVNGIVAPATNVGRAVVSARQIRHSLQWSGGSVGATVTGYDPDSIEESQ